MGTQTYFVISQSRLKTMNLQLKEDTYREFLRAGIPFSLSLPVNKPHQELKVVVYDPAGHTIRSKLVRQAGTK